MKWTEVKIKTESKFEDFVSGVLYDLGATGLAIEDPNDILQLEQSETNWDFIDSSLIDLEKNQLVIKAYFSEIEDLDQIVSNLEEKIKMNPLIDNKDILITLTILDDNDWAESWKEHYKPFKIGERILIKPSWEEVQELEGDIVIELDPGMAFGTGTHETTWLCTEAIEKYLEKGDILYDIGCGSGILSIVAVKLGASKVVGVDLDPVSVKTSNENIKINKVEDKVKIIEGNLLDVIDKEADIIVSNIIAEVIAGMAGDLKDKLKDGGIFISSGIILDKIDLVEKSLKENGFEILEIVKKNEWALIASKKRIGD